MRKRYYKVEWSNLRSFNSGQIVTNLQMLNVERQTGHVLEFTGRFAKLLNGCAGFKELVRARRLVNV